MRNRKIRQLLQQAKTQTNNQFPKYSRGLFPPFLHPKTSDRDVGDATSAAQRREPNVRAREGRLRVQGRRPAFQDGGGCSARAAPVRHLPRADAAVSRGEEPPREAGHALRTPNEHARTLTDCSEGAARHSRRWCQEDIKAWRKCFEEQRALDGRPVDSSDSPLQKARQKLDPAKYDKQGRPLK